MGFSVIAASAIIGVSVLIALELVVGTTFPIMTDVQSSYKEMKDRSIEQVQTDINITTVTAVSNASNWDLNISIENLGSISLETSKFNILVDGIDKTFVCNDAYLYPQGIVNFIIYDYNADDSTLIKAIAENGISDYFNIVIGGWNGI